jgi:hypothetical protein
MSARAWATMLAFALANAVSAQEIVFEEVSTLAGNVVPIERSFIITNAGTYDVTVIDHGAAVPAPLGPSPLASIKVAITRGSSLAAPAVNSAGTFSFTATPGTYVAHAIGVAGANFGSGNFGIRVTNASTTETVLAFSDVFSPPVSATQTVRVHQVTFDIVTAGNYELALRDLEFPRALETAGAFLFATGAAGLEAFLSIPPGTQQTQIVPLAAGNYTLVAAGAIPTGSDAGAFDVRLRAESGGTLVHGRALGVGRTQSAGDVSLSAGGHSLRMVDLQFPSAMAQGSAIVTAAGQTFALARTSDASPASFNAAAGSYQVLSYALAGAGDGAGSYAIRLLPDSATEPVLEAVATVGTSPAAPMAFAFPLAVGTAGAHRARLVDFELPIAFTTARVALIQAGAVVGSTAAGVPGPTRTLDVQTLAAGRATALVFARPPASTGPLQQTAGVFGMEVTASAGGAPLLEVTQGVGGLFNARKVSVLDPGRYEVTVADVGFPAAFSELYAVVTRGTQNLGSVLLGGKIGPFEATPGNYFINFIARANATDQAGTYGISMSKAPPLPTLSFNSDRATVDSGRTAVLTWSAQNAVSCTASGGWSGAKNASGNETTAALTSSTTFTLACTGPGGSVTQSATVNVSAAQSDGGGGGRLDAALLLLLAGALALHVNASAPSVSRRRAA